MKPVNKVGFSRKLIDGKYEYVPVYEDPLPEWATALAHGLYVLGSQLPTRDGRRMGNAHIVDTYYSEPLDETIYVILTDAGNTARLTQSELEECFYPPKYISDVSSVRAKFTPQYEFIE